MSAKKPGGPHHPPEEKEKKAAPKPATPGKAAPKPAAEKAAAPAKESKKKSDRKAPLYSFRIELARVRPKVWRRFFVPSDISLEMLNSVILDVMGWSGGHLFAYRIGGREYINPESDDMFSGNMFDSSRKTHLSSIRLDRLGLVEGSTFVHEYDFGDGWEHTLKLLSRDYQPKEPGERFGCFAGARRCPPEDCGGPWGYESLLKTLADPNDPEHEEMLEWLGGEFDPEDFDKDDVIIVMPD